MQKNSVGTVKSQISVRELHGMARLLVQRHGQSADKMAEFLSLEYGHYGDERRMNTWRAVQGVTRDMLDGRLGEASPLIN